MSKYRALEIKCDRLLQLHYVPLNQDCFVCGKPTAEMHHFIAKSQSNELRYDPKNLIPLCKGCHIKHHLSGDPQIVMSIIKKKGIPWYDDLQKRRHNICKLNREYLLNVIKSISQTS